MSCLLAAFRGDDKIVLHLKTALISEEIMYISSECFTLPDIPLVIGTGWSQITHRPSLQRTRNINNEAHRSLRNAHYLSLICTCPCNRGETAVQSHVVRTFVVISSSLHLRELLYMAIWHGFNPGIYASNII